MIESFEDFCTWVYVIVDDIWRELAPLFSRPGPEPLCSDSEVLTIALVSECKGWEKERELHSNWQPYRELFPHFPERSRFNRRRRNLMQGFNWVRWVILQLLDVAQDQQCVIDDLPIEVVQFYLVPTTRGDWWSHEATYGWVAAKKETIFGYKLHLLINLNGVIIDFALAPANADELAVAEELLFPYTDLLVLGDKAYLSAPFQSALQATQRITLLAPPRRNQKLQWPSALRYRLSQARQLIETVNHQLTEQFHIQQTPAHTFWGLCARLQTKLAAHTLCIYLNRLLGMPDFLQIKSLAFPN